MRSRQTGHYIVTILGGYRDKVPVYLSSLVHDSPQQFAGEALTNHNQ